MWVGRAELISSFSYFVFLPHFQISIFLSFYSASFTSVYLNPNTDAALEAFDCVCPTRFHSDSKRIRSGFESKHRESPRIHNVFAQRNSMASRIWSRFHSDSLRDSVMGAWSIGLRQALFECTGTSPSQS